MLAGRCLIGPRGRLGMILFKKKSLKNNNNALVDICFSNKFWVYVLISL
jgi:hypothetical protein